MTHEFIDSNHLPHDLSALNRAVFNNDYQQAQELLNRNPALINQVILPTYQSPLSNALTKQEIDYQMLAILTRQGASFAYPINVHKEFPTDFACKLRDKKLFTFLVAHGAPITHLTPHYLLARSTDIKQITVSKITDMQQIIKLMGGLGAISGFQDGENTSFEENAKKCTLINTSGGTLDYNLMSLLNLAEAIDLAPDDPTKDRLTGELKEQLTSLQENYNRKEKSDQKTLGGAISSFFYTNNTCQKEIPRPGTDQEFCKKSTF
ncbi:MULTISPECIES: ankyrin repeat domain-containing protein [unclassified Legionella]|uniref:ankyrin repeat domain-containing protein n=1 Tax=unclassified Legionella TaxID=2622702 RepID=UPI0010559CF6|nr:MULTISPECIES: ankyrin repeat domain-containing protein [unclassified Legionella]MDI9817997.1 ankyrin repeat domain-containing protein [Legionella sp. PL877]